MVGLARDISSLVGHKTLKNDMIAAFSKNSMKSFPEKIIVKLMCFLEKLIKK